jgi:alpha-galactosidase
MVNPDSDLYRAHPDWVYHVPGRPRMEQRNQLVLNLARPDVADFVFSVLDRLLTDNDISFIKWDLNRISASRDGSRARRPRRFAFRAVYGIVSRLRARHKGSCSSRARAAAGAWISASSNILTRCGRATTPTPSTGC